MLARLQVATDFLEGCSTSAHRLAAFMASPCRSRQKWALQASFRRMKGLPALTAQLTIENIRDLMETRPQNLPAVTSR